MRKPQFCLRACAFVGFFYPCSSLRALSDDLLISAASSLSTVMSELVIEFRRQNRDIDLATNFSGSGTLLRQIQRGAPVDVFISADTETMQRAVDMRLIDEQYSDKYRREQTGFSVYSWGRVVWKYVGCVT